MLKNHRMWGYALCVVLYIAYLVVSVGLKFAFDGEYFVYIQVALVWFALVVFAFLDRTFELI